MERTSTRLFGATILDECRDWSRTGLIKTGPDFPTPILGGVEEQGLPAQPADNPNRADGPEHREHRKQQAHLAQQLLSRRLAVPSSARTAALNARTRRSERRQ